MVKQASSSQSNAWRAALPSSREMAVRRVTSIFLCAAMLTVIYPFAPFSWVFPTEGVDILDSFLAPPLFLGALFFQWRIAGVIGNIAVCVLDSDPVFVYHHNMYWTMAAVECMICMGVWMVKNEWARRGSAVGLVAWMWGVGWYCTPQRLKDQAWEHLKWIWTVLAIDHARNTFRTVGNGRRRY
ncbi:hypothetical protein B0J14DRAFT_335873 [Halenospora varia]|nr:hypothetical protein B0J14DRAFT_335873 [Halenospora varia]